MNNLKEAIANFIKNHPWMTFWIVSDIVMMPASIIKAIKWDGKGISKEELNDALMKINITKPQETK